MGSNPADQSLFKAIEEGNLSAVQSALARGANPNAKQQKDKEWWPALHLACMRKALAIVKVLLEAKADVKATTKDGMTALHVAADRGLYNIVDMLLAYKAPIDAHANGGLERATPLMMAAYNGQQEVVELLLDRGAKVDPSLPGDESPLHSAIRGRDPEIVELLLQRGARMDHPYTHWMWPAICTACQEGGSEVLRVLLQAGADVNVVTEGGTPLQVAVDAGDAASVQLLLAHGARVDLPPELLRRTGHSPMLYTAACSGNLDLVKALLARGARADERCVGPGSDGEQAIHTASRLGHLPVVRHLVEQYRVSLDAKTESGDTPLHCAAGKGQLKVVKWLLQKGAAPDLPGKMATRPLHRACSGGHVEVVRLLCDAGADMLARSAVELTPAHQACFDGHPEVVKVLLDRGVQVNGVYNPSGPLLSAAACNGHVAVMELLIQRGADLNAVAPATGFTALHVACGEGKLEAAQLLLKQGAGINAVAEDSGRTPMHMAVEEGHLMLVQLMCEAGADVTKKDKAGLTPQTLAAQRSKTGVVKYFQARAAGKAPSLKATLAARNRPKTAAEEAADKEQQEKAMDDVRDLLSRGWRSIVEEGDGVGGPGIDDDEGDFGDEGEEDYEAQFYNMMQGVPHIVGDDEQIRRQLAAMGMWQQPSGSGSVSARGAGPGAPPAAPKAAASAPAATSARAAAAPKAAAATTAAAPARPTRASTAAAPNTATASAVPKAQQQQKQSSAAATSSQLRPPQQQQGQEHVCAACGAGTAAVESGGGKLRCCACLSVRYCSIDCQRKDWKQQHRSVCTARKCKTRQ